MADYAPITLRIVDEQGTERFAQSVPFELELDVREVMERAFVLSQTPQMRDPLVYDLQYFGYSEDPQFPGYLGYEVESIFGKPNNAEFFWELKIDDVPAQEGADSTQPHPGATVLWVYTPAAQAHQLSRRAKLIHERRLQRRRNPR